MMTSESSPGAWPVEDPSYVHFGRRSTPCFTRAASNVRHFERAVQSALMKTYSAWILSRGRAAYLSRTAWSMAYLPVCWLRGSAPMRTVARVARAAGRSAAAPPARARATASFILLCSETPMATLFCDAGEKEVKRYSSTGDYFGEIA